MSLCDVRVPFATKEQEYQIRIRCVPAVVSVCLCVSIYHNRVVPYRNYIHEKTTNTTFRVQCAQQNQMRVEHMCGKRCEVPLA